LYTHSQVRVLDGVLEIQGFRMNRIVLVSALGLSVAVVLKLAGVHWAVVGIIGFTVMIALLASSFRSVWMPQGEVDA
jgi:uncharacterized membrane protein YccC